jgi:SHS2 domain-containing protein
MQFGYTFLDHTADVGIEIRSPTLEGVYEYGAEALFALICPVAVELSVARTVETQGESPEALLVNLLNDLLLHFEMDRLLFRKIRVRSISEGCLVADALCEEMDENRVDTVVKAVTWHDLQLTEEFDHWRAVVYLDL